MVLVVMVLSLEVVLMSVLVLVFGFEGLCCCSEERG